MATWIHGHYYPLADLESMDFDLMAKRLGGSGMTLTRLKCEMFQRQVIRRNEMKKRGGYQPVGSVAPKQYDRGIGVKPPVVDESKWLPILPVEVRKQYKPMESVGKKPKASKGKATKPKRAKKGTYVPKLPKQRFNIVRTRMKPLEAMDALREADAKVQYWRERRKIALRAVVRYKKMGKL